MLNPEVHAVLEKYGHEEFEISESTTLQGIVFTVWTRKEASDKFKSEMRITLFKRLWAPTAKVVFRKLL